MKLLISLLILSCSISMLVCGQKLVISGPIVDTSENEIPQDHVKKSLNQYRYEPNWTSLDSRPLPTWFDQSKVGIFLHWGVFSVPAYQEWFWYNWITSKDPQLVAYMKNNYPPSFTYQDFGPQFTAEFFDPYKWTDIFKKAGAKYIVLTSKHHEGYTLWPSKYSFGWNSMDVGPKRDLVGELAKAVRNSSDIRFGLYHSMFEWFNPLYMQDKNNSFTTNTYVKQKAIPELVELVKAYKPEILWSDGEWEIGSTYWKSKEFLTWLYNSSPVKDTVVVNDRWGAETRCKNGGFYNCNDKFSPGVLQQHKWENAMTIDQGSWGYRRRAGVKDYLSPQAIITELVSSVSCGGNLLINVGPTKEGIIAPIMEERLLQMGEWLNINGDAIYSSTPWENVQNDTLAKGVWYTSKPGDKKIFAIALESGWPQIEDKDGKLSINFGSVNSTLIKINSIRLLGYKDGKKDLVWESCNGIKCKLGILVLLPNSRLVSSQWAWTFVIQHD